MTNHHWSHVAVTFGISVGLVVIPFPFGNGNGLWLIGIIRWNMTNGNLGDRTSSLGISMLGMEFPGRSWDHLV